MGVGPQRAEVELDGVGQVERRVARTGRARPAAAARASGRPPPRGGAPRAAPGARRARPARRPPRAPRRRRRARRRARSRPRRLSSIRKFWPSSRLGRTLELAQAPQARLARLAHQPNTRAALASTVRSSCLVGHAAQLGHPARGVRHVGRLVRLPAQRLRREVGRVGLHQQQLLRAPAARPRGAPRPSGRSRCRRRSRGSRARRTRRGGRAPRSSGGSPPGSRRRARAAARRCRPPRRGCGWPPAARAGRPARAAPRRRAAGRRAARGRGSSRDPSRRWRAPRDRRPPARSPRGPPRRSRRSRAGADRRSPPRRGARGPPRAPARSRARPSPRWPRAVTPAARARSTSSASGGSQKSRWQWVSTTGRPAAQAAETSEASTRGKSCGELADPRAARQRAEARRCRARGPRARAPRAAARRTRARTRAAAPTPRAAPRPASRAPRSRCSDSASSFDELPGLLVLHEAVEALDPLPDLVERERRLHPVEQVLDRLGQAVEVLRQLGGGLGLGHHAVAVAVDHRQRAAGEVAVLVGELGGVARLEALGRDLAVLSEADLAQRVVAQGVGAVELDHPERLDDVPERLGHLVLAEQQEAVDPHLARHLELGGHQERRPDDRVELEDVLADQVERGGPEAVGQVLALARVGERRVVVEERVDPDVDHLRRVPRDRHAPLQPRPAERQVLRARPG